MPRILVSECKQEISSFNPAPGRYEEFAVSFGDEIWEAHRGVTSEVSGALSVFAQRPDVEVVPGYSARAITSGGTLSDATWSRMAQEFLDAVKNAGPIDAIYFSLHGAMASVSELDPEGYLLQETRKIVGEKMPIGISLDLHGIVTDRMIRHVDALSLYHTYPHVDFYQTGERAARFLLRVIDGVNPVMVRVRIPALVRGYELITETGLFGRCVRRTQAVEFGPGGLSGGMFIGNPFTDVPELCSNVFLATEGNEAQTVAEAISIAEEFWSLRESLQQPLTPLEESVQIAADCPGRTVLVDAADATSSGASGDSNAILREMVRIGYAKSSLMPIVDAPAVDAAFRAGVGAKIRVPIGGSVDTTRFQPVELDVEVRMLSDGSFRNESHGSTWNGGRTAVLQAGKIVIVTTSQPVSLYDRSLFLAHGQNPEWFDSVVVKSPHCQPQFFSDWAERMVNVDAPGSTSANLKSLGHKICARPVFPLDEGVTFTPRAEVFRRGH